jgi:hypothetical protein
MNAPQTFTDSTPATREHDPDCLICVGGTFGIAGCLVLDVLQVGPARQRWQWAELDAGLNDCPCVQMRRMGQ